MTINEDSCPVASACLTRYNAHRDEDHLPSFGIDDSDEEAELWGEIHRSTPSVQSRILRAFYALEVTYHTVIPKLFLSASDSHALKMFIEIRAPRSVEGLDDLTAACEKYRLRASARRTTLVLKDAGRDNSAQIADIMQRHLIAVSDLVVSANHLKTTLRRKEPTGLAVVGSNLGTALFLAGESSQTVHRYLRIILRINPDNVVIPWSQQTSEPKTRLG